MVWGLLVWGWRKGIVNRETQRNPTLLRLARSEKGNVNRESHQNRLPFSVRSWRKDSENRETQRNPMLLRLARSEKGNENRESCRNPLLFPASRFYPRKFLIAPAPYLFPTYLLGADAYLHFLAAG